MLASRGYNIDSLAVGETEDPGFSRMTFVLKGDDRMLEQVRRQLEKIVTVVHVDDISSRNYVERDLMLIKVSAEAGSQRSHIRELAEIFRGRIVDVASDSVIVEISGTENKIEAFIDMIRPLGIIEFKSTFPGGVCPLGSQSKSEPGQTTMAQLRPQHPLRRHFHLEPDAIPEAVSRQREMVSYPLNFFKIGVRETVGHFCYPARGQDGPLRSALWIVEGGLEAANRGRKQIRCFVE